MEKVIRTLDELAAEARQLVESLMPAEGGATLVTLSGELGAGKTAFVQALAMALGVEESVTSPTFVLEKIYALSGQKWERLVHIDAYRLESGAELAPLGFDELVKERANLILLEWPEKVGLDTGDMAAKRIHLELRGDGSRTMTYG